MNSLLQEYHNERLKERGRSLDGRPIWRISWSTDQREKRLGTFSDFYGSIFLRQTREVREVPKYWYTPNRWILERLTFLPPNAAIHKELIASYDLDITRPSQNGTYEPIYVFQDANGEPLPVTERAIDFVLWNLEHRDKAVKLTDADMRKEYYDATDQEAAYFEAELNEAGRAPLFAFENSVFLDSEKVYKEKVGPDAIVTSKK
jgi:hypothetical protein